MSKEVINIEITILINLIKSAHIGKRHTPFRSAIKGVPSNKLNLAKKACKNLIKKGYLKPKKTGHDLDVSINPRYLAEIKNIPEVMKVIKVKLD